MVTCPSAISTTLLSLRTHKTVVPCICALSSLFRIPPLYNLDGLGQKQRWPRRVSTRKSSLPGTSGSVVFFFFFLLLFFGLAAADFLEALIERGPTEKIGRQIRIVFAGIEEDLAGAVAVAVLRDLHGGAYAVHQLKICIDVGFDVAGIIRFVRRG